jgi:hypothetical protein
VGLPGEEIPGDDLGKALSSSNHLVLQANFVSYLPLYFGRALCACGFADSINNRQRTPGASPWMNAVMMRATLMSFLPFQGSPAMRDFFNDLSAGESCPLRIPPIDRGLRFPPPISREKHSGLPPALLNRVPAGKFNRASHSENTSRSELASKFHRHKRVGIYCLVL